VRETPSDCESCRSSRRISSACAVDVGVHDRLLQRGVGLVAETDVGVDGLQNERGGRARAGTAAAAAHRQPCRGRPPPSSTSGASGRWVCNAPAVICRSSAVGRAAPGPAPPLVWDILYTRNHATSFFPAGAPDRTLPQSRREGNFARRGILGPRYRGAAIFPMNLLHRNFTIARNRRCEHRADAPRCRRTLTPPDISHTLSHIFASSDGFPSRARR
jgi:hypothetical protein